MYKLYIKKSSKFRYKVLRTKSLHIMTTEKYASFFFKTIVKTISILSLVATVHNFHIKQYTRTNRHLNLYQINFLLVS